MARVFLTHIYHAKDAHNRAHVRVLFTQISNLDTTAKAPGSHSTNFAHWLSFSTTPLSLSQSLSLWSKCRCAKVCVQYNAGKSKFKQPHQSESK